MTDLKHAVDNDADKVETAIGQDINLERPLAAFEDWSEYHKTEHQSVRFANIVAGVIIAAMFITCGLLLTGVLRIP